MNIVELNQRRKKCEEEIRKQKERLDQIAEAIWHTSRFNDEPSDEELEAIVWAKRRLMIELRDA
jgi:hypothetical protein